MFDTIIDSDLKHFASIFESMMANNTAILNGLNDRLEVLENAIQRHYDAINVGHQNLTTFHREVVERDACVRDCLIDLKARTDSTSENLTMIAKMADEQLETLRDNLTTIAKMTDEQLDDIRANIRTVAEFAIPGQVEFDYDTPKTKLRLVTKDDEEES